MKRHVIIVAPSFDEAAIRLVCDGLSALSGEPIDFDVVKDDKLLGGFIVMFDGKVYDNSFSTRLNEVYRQMSQ
jgi:F0F1-type ATP synthase delta subunit